MKIDICHAMAHFPFSLARTLKKEKERDVDEMCGHFWSFLMTPELN